MAHQVTRTHPGTVTPPPQEQVGDSSATEKTDKVGLTQFDLPRTGDSSPTLLKTRSFTELKRQRNPEQ